MPVILCPSCPVVGAVVPLHKFKLVLSVVVPLIVVSCNVVDPV